MSHELDQYFASFHTHINECLHFMSWMYMRFGGHFV
jgi:hypothetical protein